MGLVRKSRGGLEEGSEEERWGGGWWEKRREKCEVRGGKGRRKMKWRRVRRGRISGK